MAYRFHISTPIQGDRYFLDGDQAHHLQSVMRKQIGDKVVLFDGSGFEYPAEIVSLKKRKVELVVGTKTAVSRELKHQITIATALPKGNRQKFLIEKLVELGVARLIPLSTERSVADCNENARQRLERQVIEACKQCGRNTLMEVVPQATVKELLATEFDSNTVRLLADPYSETAIVESTQADHVAVAIGPEGGFTEDESAQLSDSGWKPVRFGPTILRIETAALVAASLLGIARE